MHGLAQGSAPLPTTNAVTSGGGESAHLWLVYGKGQKPCVPGMLLLLSVSGYRSQLQLARSTYPSQISLLPTHMGHTSKQPGVAVQSSRVRVVQLIIFSASEPVRMRNHTHAETKVWPKRRCSHMDCRKQAQATHACTCTKAHELLAHQGMRN